MKDLLKAEDCGHRNAFALAQGTDSADVIASAVLRLCELEVAQWVVSAQKTDPSGLDAVNARIGRGFTDDAVTEVLRARAGHCPAPSMRVPN